MMPKNSLKRILSLMKWKITHICEGLVYKRSKPVAKEEGKTDMASTKFLWKINSNMNVHVV